MAYTIAFFGTKPYDEASFNDKNKEYGFELRYYKGHLNKHNVILTQNVDAVCIFVNDTADALPSRYRTHSISRSRIPCCTEVPYPSLSERALPSGVLSLS